MKREEAKEIRNRTGINAIDLIDKIYDYFDSMTCNNCKYLKDTGTRIECDLEVIENYNFLDEQHFDITEDFGCNKWEIKK